MGRRPSPQEIQQLDFQKLAVLVLLSGLLAILIIAREIALAAV
jgi:hypothetical protein